MFCSPERLLKLTEGFTTTEYLKLGSRSAVVNHKSVLPVQPSQEELLAFDCCESRTECLDVEQLPPVVELDATTLGSSWSIEALEHVLHLPSVYSVRSLSAVAIHQLQKLYSAIAIHKTN